MLSCLVSVFDAERDRFLFVSGGLVCDDIATLSDRLGAWEWSAAAAIKSCASFMVLNFLKRAFETPLV